MNQDLKIIKKKYGEKMAHFCREYFSTILETEGLLSNLMLEHFEPNHDLYKDIKRQNKENEFKDFIYSLIERENDNHETEVPSPKDLLKKAGYDLYECTSEEDIQKFKKYYAKGEELCTFNGGRLERCHVFFAVKKNVSDIKREDFLFPNRQDEYGTSVLSIQFTRDASHTLSIKNRYNHHVSNPDSTFSNNLDNIVEGLTTSFAEHYGLVQKIKTNNFELKNYVIANDGKFYKYNQEIYNVYYCPNNIIIDNFEVKRYEKEKYIVFDYFILDLVKKEIRLYCEYIEDSFSSTISNIQKIEVVKKQEEKEIIVTLKDNKIVISLNKNNQMIKLESNIKRVDGHFLCNNKFLKEISFPLLEKVGRCFLFNNIFLEKLNLPSLEYVGDDFLCDNKNLKKLYLPKLRIIKNDFLFYNNSLKEISLPSLEVVGNAFLCYNQYLKNLSLPSLKKVGDNFLNSNIFLEELSLPYLEETGDTFLFSNGNLKTIDLPLLRKVGEDFISTNEIIQEINLPSLKSVGSAFLYSVNSLKELSLPSLEETADAFLVENTSLRKLNLPVLKKVGDDFLYNNIFLEEVYLPSLEEAGNNFLEYHPIFTREDFISKPKRLSFN